MRVFLQVICLPSVSGTSFYSNVQSGGILWVNLQEKKYCNSQFAFILAYPTESIPTYNIMTVAVKGSNYYSLFLTYFFFTLLWATFIIFGSAKFGMNYCRTLNLLSTSPNMSTQTLFDNQRTLHTKTNFGKKLCMALHNYICMVSIHCTFRMKRSLCTSWT